MANRSFVYSNCSEN